MDDNRRSEEKRYPFMHLSKRYGADCFAIGSGLQSDRRLSVAGSPVGMGSVKKS